MSAIQVALYLENWSARKEGWGGGGGGAEAGGKKNDVYAGPNGGHTHMLTTHTHTHRGGMYISSLHIRNI